MFLINCPFCGEREQSEFKAGGEAHILRPKQPTELSDDEWAEYLFMRKNIKGVQFERWNHTHGCRKWFNMVRDTSNDKIHAVYKMGEKPPVPQPQLKYKPFILVLLIIGLASGQMSTIPPHCLNIFILLKIGYSSKIAFKVPSTTS